MREFWKYKYEYTIKKEEYCVFVSCGYKQYSCCLDDYTEKTGEWRITVRKWRKDHYKKNSMVSDHVCEGVTTGAIDKKMRNKIYWCLKNREISFAEIKKYFESIGGGPAI